MDVVIPIIVGIVALAFGLVSGFFVSRNRQRRTKTHADSSAETVVADARQQAQRLLARAEDEGRAKADTYREREEAALEHRRLEMKSSEERLNQREQTLEQRAGNLAQREQMLIHREQEASDLRAESDHREWSSRQTMLR